MSHTDRADHGDGRDDSAVETALAKAVDLLALRQHFAAEIRAKLKKRGFDSETTTAVVSRLEVLGYLDDVAAARAFAEQRALRQGWGPMRLRAELGRRGVDESVCESAVAQAFPDGEGDAVRAAASRWRDRGGTGRQRLARYLDRRGFSKGAIIEILSEFAGEAESNHEKS